MAYEIKAHPTRYNGVLFRSRLEARWAAFFELAGWEWKYEPFDFQDWVPDFWVKFHCGHSECGGFHTLLIEVKPYLSLAQFDGHPCTEHPYGEGIPADASAAFGNDPSVTEWEMVHGAGGGTESVGQWVDNCEELWKLAGELTQWHHAANH